MPREFHLLCLCLAYSLFWFLLNLLCKVLSHNLRLSEADTEFGGHRRSHSLSLSLSLSLSAIILGLVLFCYSPWKIIVFWRTIYNSLSYIVQRPKISYKYDNYRTVTITDQNKDAVAYAPMPNLVTRASFTALLTV